MTNCERQVKNILFRPHNVTVLCTRVAHKVKFELLQLALCLDFPIFTQHNV